MRTYWILPNRDQKDDILASDGEKTIPLRQILDPKLRPEGFSHGVPAEILEKCGPKAFAEILFAQRFPAWDGGKQLFSVLTTAGLDSSGRVVHLGSCSFSNRMNARSSNCGMPACVKKTGHTRRICFIN